jgi:hypothetical protein
LLYILQYTSRNFRGIFPCFLTVFLHQEWKAVFKRKMEIKFPQSPLVSGTVTFSLLPSGALGGHSCHEVQSRTNSSLILTSATRLPRSDRPPRLASYHLSPSRRYLELLATTPPPHHLGSKPPYHHCSICLYVSPSSQGCAPPTSSVYVVAFSTSDASTGTTKTDIAASLASCHRPESLPVSSPSIIHRAALTPPELTTIFKLRSISMPPCPSAP